LVVADTAQVSSSLNVYFISSNTETIELNTLYSLLYLFIYQGD